MTLNLRPSACICALLLLLPPLCALSQQNPAPPAKSDSELDAQARQADELDRQGKSLAALPLYEELHARRPANSIYTEGLGMSYVGKAGADSTPAEAVADRNRARELFKLAQAQGDNSPLLQVMMEKMGPSESAPPESAPPLAADDPRAGAFAEAEQLFSKGDLAGAVKLYAQAWEKHPDFYSAPLYAGDSEYKLGHYDEAGVWFVRAIAIDPDFETAHRYWGDCLVIAGKPLEARKQYIEALIGDPYQKAPRLQLRTWAEANHMRLVPPPISLPAEPVAGKNNNVTITLAPAKENDPLAPIWLSYSLNAATWHTNKFTKTFPNEKLYRHSLAEEIDGIRLMLTVLRENKLRESQYSPAIRALVALEKDNMLECWVLLDNPDQGTAQDYLAYRKLHHDLLRAYIEKYDLHLA